MARRQPERVIRSRRRTGLGDLVTRRRWLVLAFAVIGVLAALALGTGAAGKLQPGGFSDPSSPSQIAADRLSAAGLGEPNLILLVTPRSGSVDSPAAAAFGRRLTTSLAAQPGVHDVSSYWTTGRRVLESRNGRQGLLLAFVTGDDARAASIGDALIARYATHPQGAADATVATVQAGGLIGTDRDVSKQVATDLGRAESIAIPITLLLLVIAFGSATAALLPIAIGLVAIAGSLAALDVVASFTSVSIYALNLTTALGLGLAIDYSLLIVNRFRENLGRGLDTRAAVRATLSTAGRTVAFSAAAVSAALASLLGFPIYFLRSMAYAGISVVVVATAAATIVLPALLAVLGPRVNGGHIRRLGSLDASESSFWLRSTRAVMRRPVLAVAAVAVILAVAAAPLLHVRFGIPDDRVLPATASARQVGDALRSNFAQDSGDTIAVVTNHSLSPGTAGDYAVALSEVPGITAVYGPTGAYADGHLASAAAGATLRQPANGTWLSLVSTRDPESAAGAAQVALVREVAVPGGATAYVGGQAATLVDLKHALGSRLPLAVALIALITFAVLFLFTGSVFLPLKALVLNAMGLSAVLGIIVWIFQEGHLSGFFGFTPGDTSITMPLLLFVIAFGLSMDYEVFVLSRIKELHDAGHDDDYAVSHGLARSGRIVSTAAALLSVTFFAFGLSKISFLQLFGIGTAIAILIDATLLRGVLVPALMRLAGSLNWWSPRVLRRLHGRIGLSEGMGAGGRPLLPAPAVLLPVGGSGGDGLRGRHRSDTIEPRVCPETLEDLASLGQH